MVEMDDVSARQLKIDLLARTRERMRKVIGDTFELYEMAELEPQDAATALADVLMKETVTVLSASEGSAKAIGTTIAAMVRFKRGEINQDELERLLQVLGGAVAATGGGWCFAQSTTKRV